MSWQQHQQQLRPILALLLGVLGVLGIGSSLAGLVRDGVSASPALAFPLYLLVLPAAWWLWSHRRTLVPLWLVFEPAGFRMDTGDTLSAIGWNELADVTVSTIWTLGQPYNGFRWVFLWIDFVPADTGFESRHPELVAYRKDTGGAWGYRIPLGRSEERLPAVDNGLRLYAPGLYRGQTDGGFKLNHFRYL